MRSAESSVEGGRIVGRRSTRECEAFFVTTSDKTGAGGAARSWGFAGELPFYDRTRFDGNGGHRDFVAERCEAFACITAGARAFELPDSRTR